MKTTIPTACVLSFALFLSLSPSGNDLYGQQPRVYQMRIQPHWMESGERFWYKRMMKGGTHEFILVDALNGKRSLAFDHQKLSVQLDRHDVKHDGAGKLPIKNLHFDDQASKMWFTTDSRRWVCDLETHEIQHTEKTQDAGELRPLTKRNIPNRSQQSRQETYVIFDNRTDSQLRLRWIGLDGRRVSYGHVDSGEKHRQHTFVGHVWELVKEDGVVIAVYRANSEHDAVAVIREAQLIVKPEPSAPQESERQPLRPSPPKDLRAEVRDGDIYLVNSREDTSQRLTDDGSEQSAYGSLQWSPDSKTLVAFKTTPGDRGMVHLVESSPREGGRAKLHSRAYPLPGDAFTQFELVLVDAESAEVTRPEVDVLDFGHPRLRWIQPNRFVYPKIDRGHQRFRLIEVDTSSGQVRNIIDEQSDTFVWTAHSETLHLRRINWISNQELIYVSQRDGWRHLYLINVDTGEMEQITTGPFVVRGIDRIDLDERRIWFHASGKNTGQDPYLLHYYRVNFDGSQLTALTEGDGNHSIQYSPDGRYFLDTYSRVDLPPVHELRRTSDGQLVCHLEQADASEIDEHNISMPIVFSAKGRDGQTDIWGFVVLPADYDPAKRYPVIEDIYAGPHGFHVPKTYHPGQRYKEFVDQGFAVVKIDGMGTAHRSKAFHDVCWHNLKDAGIPDRILWIKALAKQYPGLDTRRVGIYGTSAGGQNAAAALLFHGDFYKVAVASCGCHDNRMDKASWNEQWMGYPVGPQYSESSNIDNAHRLNGHLMLILGEMDRNVPPESTMRFADALIKADKDFELIVLPGVGHSDGGRYGRRRRLDFFRRHLLQE